MIIELKHVTRTFPARNAIVTALADINFQLESGTLACLSGPSGSGKSTLLFTLGGMLRPDSGTVRVLEQDLYGLSKSERAAFRAAHIGFIFQIINNAWSISQVYSPVFRCSVIADKLIEVSSRVFGGILEACLSALRISRDP